MKHGGAQSRTEGEEAAADDPLELINPAENYCTLMLEVREAAAEKGLTFREVMTAMARRVLAELTGRELAAVKRAAEKLVEDGASQERAHGAWGKTVGMMKSTAAPGKRNAPAGKNAGLIAEVLRLAECPLSARAIEESLGERIPAGIVGPTLRNPIGLRMFEKVVVSEGGENGFGRRVLWRLKEEGTEGQRGGGTEVGNDKAL